MAATYVGDDVMQRANNGNFSGGHLLVPVCCMSFNVCIKIFQLMRDRVLLRATSLIRAVRRVVEYTEKAVDDSTNFPTSSSAFVSHFGAMSSIKVNNCIFFSKSFFWLLSETILKHEKKKEDFSFFNELVWHVGRAGTATATTIALDYTKHRLHFTITRFSSRIILFDRDEFSLASA